MEKTLSGCEQCKKKFSNLSNLKKHVKRLHPDKLDYFRSLEKRKQKNYAYPCNQCHKNFMHQHNLKAHLKIHGVQTETKANGQRKCALCDYSSGKSSVLDHYRQNHDIIIEKKKLMFASIKDFYDWKDDFELNTHSRFVRESSKILKGRMYKSFICHRSGTYSSKGRNLRHLKVQGSHKIGAVCPASIKLRQSFDDRYEVEFIDTHVGHQNEIAYLNLTKCERDFLAKKIALKISFDDILDEVRDSVCDSELKRLHLLTKKDLYNIEQCYNLTSSSIRHASDFVSMESWIDDMREKGDAILFYKSQGKVAEEWPALKDNDFVLIIMTAAQTEMLKKYGSNCICIDGTHGTNSYDFDLITILVIDDIRQGFPCSFLISNRSDCAVLSIFFYYVKTRIGSNVCPDVFMSDMSDVFFDAWMKVMLPPKLRLYCTWYVDQAWRKNLSKIKSKEKQMAVYKKMRVILEERDEAAFNIMHIELYNQLLEDTDTVDFARYFKDNFMSTTHCWAFCHRLGAGLNTNMHLERMHLSLKHTYLKGKHVQRLDKGISAIMRMVRDKCIDRLIILHKGKLCKKLQIIRNRHESSVNLDISLITPFEDGWNVLATKFTELCSVQKVKDACDCQLRCIDCTSCLHQFSCSCLDSTIRYNMCKHIHLVCRYLQKHNISINPPIVTEFKGICTSPSPSEAVPEIPSFADTVDSEIKTEDLNSLTSCCEITEEGIVLETPYPIKDEIIEIRKETTVEKTLEEKYAELLEENEKLRHKAVMLETTNKAQETEIEALEYNLKKLLQDVDELTSYNTKLQQTLLAAQIVIPKEGDY